MPKRLLVELLRVQPREAEVLAARLRSARIDVSLGADPIYESLNFADGVPVLVAKRTGLRRLGFWLNQPRLARAYAGLHVLLSR
jgi:hypothetical protein